MTIEGTMCIYSVLFSIQFVLKKHLCLVLSSVGSCAMQIMSNYLCVTLVFKVSIMVNRLS